MNTTYPSFYETYVGLMFALIVALAGYAGVALYVAIAALGIDMRVNSTFFVTRCGVQDTGSVLRIALVAMTGLIFNLAII